MAFEGFSKDTLAFAADLAEHNDRVWFAENKERYERAVLGPEREFVAAMGEALTEIAPNAHADPRVNGSIFRINRDTRFSKDKSPYKTHLDMWFWVGDDRKTAPGYFVRIVPDAVWVGGGAHTVTNTGLKRMREAIAAEPTGSELAAILERLEDVGYAIGDQKYKRVPAGYPADHPRADLLKFGSLHAMKADLPVPEEFYSPRFAGWCGEQFAPTIPLVNWLAAVL